MNIECARPHQVSKLIDDSRTRCFSLMGALCHEIEIESNHSLVNTIDTLHDKHYFTSAEENVGN